uniref:Serine aminopeptidase S33 domain-containing protein n=1 Tax=Acrobeloides nanus TaxID=290746 RepID=A0A914C9Q3_9BILA
MSSVIRTASLLALFPLIFLYVIVPALFYFFPHFMQHIFFLHYVRIPFVDYTNLSQHEISSFGRNFYLEESTLNRTKKLSDKPKNSKNPRLGTWHVLPATISTQYMELNQIPTDSEMEALLDKEHHSIIVYFHGNSFDRTTKHRCELYNVLSAMDFHVLAIDYRGYGDSTGHPSEDGLIEDALSIYEYAKQMAPSKNIYIWGHSMGTGVASRFVAELSDIGLPPIGLVLESPFNNLKDAVMNHPFSKPFRKYPFFDEIFVNPLMRSGLSMSSDKHIQRITCPILVLHAQDDHVIPYILGRRLVEAAQSTHRDIQYVEFEAERGFLHKYIHRAKELPDLVTRFFQHCETRSRSKNRTTRTPEEVDTN